MQPDNSYLRKRAKLQLAWLYAITLILLVVILSAFWGPLPSHSGQVQHARLSTDVIEEHRLLEDVNFLHARFKQLQQKTGGSGGQLSASGEEVTAAENAFRKTMDSVESKSVSYSSVNKKKLYDIFSSFNAAINHSKPGNPQLQNNETSAVKDDAALKNKQISDLEAELKESREKANSASQDAANLARELQSRNTRITELEKQLKDAPKSTGISPQDYASLQKDVQAKNSRIADLEKQLKNAPKSTGISQQDYAKVQKDLQVKNTRIAELEKQLQEKTPLTASYKELEKLRSDNKYLSLALSSQYKQTTDLAELNKQLRAEMEKLKKRPQ